MVAIPKIKDSMLARIWEEFKHINYQQLNEKAGQAFTLVLAGSPDEIDGMRAWLESVDYPLLRQWADPVRRAQDVDHARLRRRLRTVRLGDAGDLAAMAEEDRALLRQALCCVTTPRWSALLAPHARTLHVFEAGGAAELAD